MTWLRNSARAEASRGIGASGRFTLFAKAIHLRSVPKPLVNRTSFPEGIQNGQEHSSSRNWIRRIAFGDHIGESRSKGHGRRH